jgi:DNA-binding transcriptional LysR family regulator
MIFPAAEAAYMSTALALVEAGLGITILPRMAINLKAYPELRVRSIGDIRLIRPIGVATKRNYFVSPAARAFMETLQAVSGAYMRSPEAAGSSTGEREYVHLQ